MSAAAKAGPALPVTGLPMSEMAAKPISVAMSVPMAKAMESKMMVVVVVAVMVVEMMKVVRVVMAEEMTATEAVTAKTGAAETSTSESMSARTTRRGVDLSEDEAEDARSNNGADFTRKHRSPCRARARPILSSKQRMNSTEVAGKPAG
jgi:hypothetical protein